MKTIIYSTLSLLTLLTSTSAFAGPIEAAVSEIESSTFTKCEYQKTSWGLRLPGVLFYSASFDCKERDLEFIFKVKAKDFYNTVTTHWDVVVR